MEVSTVWITSSSMARNRKRKTVIGRQQNRTHTRVWEVQKISIRHMIPMMHRTTATAMISQRNGRKSLGTAIMIPGMMMRMTIGKRIIEKSQQKMGNMI